MPSVRLCEVCQVDRVHTTSHSRVCEVNYLAEIELSSVDTNSGRKHGRKVRRVPRFTKVILHITRAKMDRHFADSAGSGGSLPFESGRLMTAGRALSSWRG